MNSFIISQIRTYVPILVGALAAWLLTKGVELDTDTQAGLIVFLTGLLQGLYYLIVRLLEKRWPKVGVLLGVASKPVYRTESK